MPEVNQTDWKKDAFYFGEEDFAEKMQTLALPKLRSVVRKVTFTSFDGTRLAGYYCLHERAKGTIVMLHGFCEFFAKYHEMMYYFYQAGYSVFFLELRGHGHSQHLLLDREKVHVASFDDYERDVQWFLEKVVMKKQNSPKRILYCHSMGGCVGALFLERHPGYFDRAIFSSPMLALNWNGIPRIAVMALAVFSKLLRKERHYLPGQHGFDDVPTFSHSSILSKARYHYMFDGRRHDAANRTYGGTYAWAAGSMRGMDQAQMFASRIHIPVLLCTAGLDTMVDNRGHNRFARHCRTVKRLYFPGSKHEIFNAKDEERIRYYKSLFAFMENRL